jgi:hypothetical protein
MAFTAAIAFGLVAFWLVADAIHKPRPPKPTIPDVWATIKSAQNTLDEGYALIYGGTSE